MLAEERASNSNRKVTVGRAAAVGTRAALSGRMRLNRAACLLLLGWACDETDESGPTEVVQTPLSGIVFLSRTAAGSGIEIRDYLEGREGDVIAEGIADDEGRWMVDLGALSGDFLVRAMTVEGVHLAAVAERVGVGEGEAIVVSPVTHLAAAYVRYLVSIGYALEEAHLKARRLFHVHFGRLDHHRIEPHAAIGDSGQPVMTLTPSVTSGILLASLELLLEELAAGSTGTVLEALVEDVESDGVFDGHCNGEPLSFGLDGQALRRTYADAIRRFLASERNATVFVAADLAEVINEIERSQSELFPSGVVDGDQVGPTVKAFAIVGEGDTELDPARGVRGQLTVRASFDDPAGVSEARIETADGRVLEDEAADAKTVETRIDTSTLADGMSSFALVAIDGAGNVARSNLVLLIDNTRPTLSVDPPAIRSSGQVTITGTVSDATSGMDVVEVGIFGQPPIVISDLSNGISVVVPILCNVVEDIDVVARDRAGNEQPISVTGYCDDQPPQIQVVASTFVQEGGLMLELDPNGSVVYSTGSAASMTLDDQSAWPVRIEKYFNRLDEQSPNLPRIRFFASDRAQNSAASADVEVAYRYLVNGVERRPFSPLARPSAGEPYDIPISYQTLGTDLATAGRDALHRIEVVATDAAGNRANAAFDFFVELLSPPVWMTGCDVATEVRNHTLSAANFHTMYGSGAETDVAEGSLRYVLDLAPGSLANGNEVSVEPMGIDVRTRIVELGEDKFQEPTSRNFVVAFEQLGQYCPFNTQGVYLNQAGVNERTRLFDQTWACVQGLYPNDRTFSSGVVVNDDAPHAVATFVLSQSGGALSPAGGAYAIAPDAAFILRVAMREPVVRLQGTAYDWSQNPSAPAGYVATIANANARYRMPVAFGRHHVGVDRWNVPNGGWPQERSFQTRSYVGRIEVVTTVDPAARHASLPALEIVVRKDPSCSAAVVYVSQL
jgi:hypothetical protein